MKNALSVLFTLMFLVVKAYADEPPSWTPYKIVSENGGIFSWIHFGDNDTTKSPWERKWALTVYTKDSTELWEQQINPTGYPEGKLSNNGKYFSYVNYWYYSDSPVVEVYRRNRTPIIITGDKFGIPISVLQQTSSHQLWLDDKGYHYANGAAQQLIINTRDSNTWAVDLETGELNIVGVNKNYVYVLLALALLIILLYIIFRRRNKILPTLAQVYRSATCVF
ncbi:hypothetical protein AAE02nite_02740 [Adhaeribacter aerolatus]|uniref:Uncharacterized protein n=1 Tax=Adhaeribacter aerolatus TaxID=670289 RepID=A0A512ASD3_9BACT|nr:LPXTG cell wall anchor domain-containing protein [Adhaeribacter aerolatus]GEO02610.1 hypothetical protein AAE02nite_02740 [Adhaeribacter aerolatus]